MRFEWIFFCFFFNLILVIFLSAAAVCAAATDGSTKKRRAIENIRRGKKTTKSSIRRIFTSPYRIIWSLSRAHIYAYSPPHNIRLSLVRSLNLELVRSLYASVQIHWVWRFHRLLIHRWSRSTHTHWRTHTHVVRSFVPIVAYNSFCCFLCATVMIMTLLCASIVVAICDGCDLNVRSMCETSNRDRCRVWLMFS